MIDLPELATNYLVSKEIDFGATGAREIYQNVKYILLTELFSVPLDREFGMNFVMVDKPTEVAQLMLEQECAMKIALYEPRCYFTRIDYNRDETRLLPEKLKPEVSIKLLDITSLPLVPIVESLPSTATIIAPEPSPPSTGAGQPGPPGERGSYWYSGIGEPGIIAGSKAQDMYLNTSNGDVFQFDGTRWINVKNKKG